MITEADEFAHQPAGEPHPQWQENFFVIAWSIDSGTGILIHCKRSAASGRQIARIAACVNGRTISCCIEEPIRPGILAVGGLTLHVEEPFRSLRLTGSCSGTEGVGPLGFIAWRKDGTTRVDVDVRITSRLTPADFATAFAMLDTSFRSGSENDRDRFEDTQHHYEQGGRCEGGLAVDGTRYALDGLFVRDHTWGVREESTMMRDGYGFWTATSLDDGDLFFNVTGVTTPDGTHAVGVIVDVNGMSTTTNVDVRFDPAPGLLAFDSTLIRIGGDRPVVASGRTQTHLVKYLPGSGRGRFDDNGISAVTAGESTGFGVHEYAGQLSPAQTAELEDAET